MVKDEVKMDSVKLPADFDTQQIGKAVKALVKHAAKSKADSLFLDAAVRIMMDISAFKIPEGIDKFFNIRLNHPLYADLTELEVLFVVPDVKDRDPDHIVGEVKDALRNSSYADKINVRTVMTFTQFRDDYATHEAKRALAKSVDVVIAENKIWKMIPSVLGRQFYKTKKFPLSIPGRQFEKRDVGHQIYFALHKTVLNLSLKGLTSTIVVGQDSMDEDMLVDNVKRIVSWLNANFPGHWNNIQKISLHTGQEAMPSLPIHISLGSINDVVKTPRTKRAVVDEPVEDEISTQLGKRIKVFSNGNLQAVPSDEKDELDDILQ